MIMRRRKNKILDCKRILYSQAEEIRTTVVMDHLLEIRSFSIIYWGDIYAEHTSDLYDSLSQIGQEIVGDSILTNKNLEL